MNNPCLYGLAGAEQMWDEPHGVWESQINGENGTHWIIEQWTSRSARQCAPHASSVAEHIAEMASDETGEGAWDQWSDAVSNPLVISKIEEAIQLMASSVNFWTAARKVGEITVTLDDSGEPVFSDVIPVGGAS